MKSKISIIIVDDHEIFRDGLKSVLSQIEDFRIIGEAENGEYLLKLLNKVTCDVILMDIEMPIMDGIEATKQALNKIPSLKIITLSSYGQQVYYQKMISAGAHGFVQKKSGKYELEKAIKAVYNGGNYFPQEILKKIITKPDHKDIESITEKKWGITKRELEILQLICNGLTNHEIADNLYISPKTVDNHRTNLLSKTSTRNSANLVMFAIKNQLVKF